MWHEYLKEFAKSEGLNDFSTITNTDTVVNFLFHLAGKAATADNPGIFNKEASVAYKSLTKKEKESLQQRSVDPVSELMIRRKVVQSGIKIFARIQHLGYIFIAGNPIITQK